MGHIGNNTSSDSSVVADVFVVTVTFSPSRCLVVTGIFTELLPNSDRRNTHTDIQTGGAVEMDPVANFHEDGFRHSQANRDYSFIDIDSMEFLYVAMAPNPIFM
jgi:hypothetical protein